MSAQKLLEYTCRLYKELNFAKVEVWNGTNPKRVHTTTVNYSFWLDGLPKKATELTWAWSDEKVQEREITDQCQALQQIWIAEFIQKLI